MAQPIVAAECPLHVHRCGSRTIELVELQPPGPAPPLPDSLVVLPGRYLVEDGTIDLSRDGVYRVLRLGSDSRQRVVCRGGVARALELIGWLWTYGNADEGVSLGELRRRARRKKLSVLCGTSALLAVSVLEDLGIRARLVMTLSDGPWNHFDNGHTLVEAFDPASGWVLFDPSFKCVFEARGRRLVLPAFLEAVRRDLPYRIVATCGGPKLGYFRTKGFDYTFWAEERFSCETALRSWYRRVAGFPVILDSGVYRYGAGADDAARLDAYFRHFRMQPAERVDLAEFGRRFYDSEPSAAGE
ncbi:MAG: transglutaminase-like domain-containing protein [Planctomycetes bacterium]|nr:transglutaminase-like domain-containing protein [Planctomycetota bacterium]